MRIRHAIARVFWGLSRWRMSSYRVPEGGAGILIGAPHTSNWDFVLMLAMSWRLRLPVKFLVKNDVYRWPLRHIVRALGGLPVDRKHPVGIAEGLIARARAGERFYLVITPEGTRRKVEYWKSGFYRIAREADLPVTLGFVDRATMTAGLGPTIELSGDVRADMDRVRAFYADKTGFDPQRRSEPRLREEGRAPKGPPV